VLAGDVLSFCEDTIHLGSRFRQIFKQAAAGIVIHDGEDIQSRTISNINVELFVKIITDFSI